MSAPRFDAFAKALYGGSRRLLLRRIGFGGLGVVFSARAAQPAATARRIGETRACPSCGGGVAAEPGSEAITTFVIVHGGWLGGSQWTPIARRLRATGHEAYTPTLTGIGERAHLLSPEVDLATHV